ncbi:hypothetical protein ABH892_005359, partial [Paenibacillus sp. RC254]
DGMYQNLSVGFCKQNPYSLVVQFSKIKHFFFASGFLSSPQQLL